MMYWLSKNDKSLYIASYHRPTNTDGFGVYVKSADVLGNAFYKYSHWAEEIDTDILKGPFETKTGD
jgi:hypothetical protein